MDFKVCAVRQGQVILNRKLLKILQNLGVSYATITAMVTPAPPWRETIRRSNLLNIVSREPICCCQMRYAHGVENHFVSTLGRRKIIVNLRQEELEGGKQATNTATYLAVRLPVFQFHSMVLSSRV
jgi:hypothetical protein